MAVNREASDLVASGPPLVPLVTEHEPVDHYPTRKDREKHVNPIRQLTKAELEQPGKTHRSPRPKPDPAEIETKQQLRLKRKRAMLRRWGPRCWYCRRGLTVSTCTIDHLQPLSRGGPRTIENERPCCRRCNQAKGDMTFNEFITFCALVAGVHSENV